MRRLLFLPSILILLIIGAALVAEVNTSGTGSAVTANAGTNLNTSLLALDSTVNGLLKPASTLAAVTTLGSITSALPPGGNILGFVRIETPGCGSLVTNFALATVGVAITTGTTITSTTTCVTFAYANNITNSAVTLRIADKAGTPVIWLGGNADFTIPANSNMKIPLEGITFTSGITAIAGTAAAINLQINGLQ